MLFIALLVRSQLQQTHWTVLILIRLYHLFFQNDTCTFLLLLTRGFVVLSMVISISTSKSNGKNNQITKSRVNFNAIAWSVFFPVFCLKWPKWIYIFYWIRACRSIQEYEHKYMFVRRVLNFDQSVQNDWRFFFAEYICFRWFDFDVILDHMSFVVILLALIEYN